MDPTQSLPTEKASMVVLPIEMTETLLRENDASRLLRKLLEQVRSYLQARWSVALTSGRGELADLLIVHDCPSYETVLDQCSLQPSEDKSLQWELQDQTAHLVSRLEAAVTLRCAFGPIEPAQRENCRVLLQQLGAVLPARLQEIATRQSLILANRALERRISDLSLLFKGLDVTLSSVELTKVLRAFLTCVTSGEAIGFNRAFLLLIDEEQRELRGTVAVGPASGEEAHQIWNRLDAEQLSLEEVLRQAIESPTQEPAEDSLAGRIRRVVIPLDPDKSILARAATSENYNDFHMYRGEEDEPFAEIFGAQEFVVIPILGRERTLGVIVADRIYNEKPIEEDRVYLLSGLANHVGVVIENALMFEDVSSRYAELNEVQYINRALLASADYGDVLRQIAKTSASMLQATGCLLFIADQDQIPRLEMQYAATASALPPRAVERCTEIAAQTLHRNNGVLDFDLEAESASGVRANLVSAPMSIDNEVVGVLVVYRAHVEQHDSVLQFDRHSKRFLSIIADQAAIAVLSGRRLQTIRDDQQQIEKLNDLLYRNEKLAALGQASSQIAHEIRNPLTALGGFARRMLRSPGITGEDREAAEVIVRETSRLERILNDQLAFVRSARLKLKPSSVNTIVKESITLLSHMIDARDVQLELDLEADMPMARLDSDRIKQVLVNLLMNAIAAIEPAGKVRIGTFSREQRVFVEMANDGPPIPAEVETTLFMPFATTRQEGTGLGLAVCHQIVMEHGGRIQVRSEEDWGSVFRIELPGVGLDDAI